MVSRLLGAPLVVLDVAVEASDRLGTVQIIVALEDAIHLVKLGLNTSLVTASVRLTGGPGEVRDRGRRERHPPESSSN